MQGVDLTLLLFFNYSGYYVGNRWCVCGGRGKFGGQEEANPSPSKRECPSSDCFELVHQLFLLRLQLKHWLLRGLQLADSSCRSWDLSFHNGSPNPQYLGVGLYLKIESLKSGD